MKTVFMPAQPFYRIGEAEGVYAAHATRGLILKKAGRWFDRYEKGEPRKLHYRLEFFKGKGPDEERLELYEGAGWKLVSFCAYTGHAVFVSEAPLAEELYSDDASELVMLRRLRRARLVDGLLVAVILVLNAMQLTGFGRIGFYQMLALSNCIVVFAALIFALLLLQGCYGICRLSMLIGRIKRGLPVDHNARLSKLERVQRTLCLTLTAAAVLTFGLLFVEAYQVSKEHPLPVSSAGQPWFEAADVFADSHRMMPAENPYQGADNVISCGSTWLYPESYSVESQTAGDIRLLYVDCYRARSEKLAEKLAWDVAKHSIWLGKDDAPTVEADERFDLVLRVRFDRVFRRGQYVYAVTCIETGEKGATYWDTIYDYIDLKMQEWEG